MSSSEYTQEQIDTALLAYWLEGESSRRAAEVTGIPARTIYDWANSTRRERYLDVVQRNAPLFDREILRKNEAIQLNALEGIKLAVDKTVEQLKDGTHKNPDQAAQRLTVTMGILADKWLVIQGRPNQISQPADVSQIEASIRAKFPWMVTESTADEVNDAELVEHT